jgi:hypothetical protein
MQNLDFIRSLEVARENFDSAFLIRKLVKNSKALLQVWLISNF